MVCGANFLIFKAFIIVCAVGLECETYSQVRDYSNLNVCMAAAVKLKKKLNAQMPSTKFVTGCMDGAAEMETRTGNPPTFLTGDPPCSTSRPKRLGRSLAGLFTYFQPTNTPHKVHAKMPHTPAHRIVW